MWQAYRHDGVLQPIWQIDKHLAISCLTHRATLPCVSICPCFRVLCLHNRWWCSRPMGTSSGRLVMTTAWCRCQRMRPSTPCWCQCAPSTSSTAQQHQGTVCVGGHVGVVCARMSLLLESTNWQNNQGLRDCHLTASCSSGPLLITCCCVCDHHHLHNTNNNQSPPPCNHTPPQPPTGCSL